MVRDVSEAWESLATDIFEFKGNYYLIVSCRFSGYIDVRQMSTHSTKETIQQFQSVFAELGIPRHLHCDRGSNYTNMEFQSFMQGLNVELSYMSRLRACGPVIPGNTSAIAVKYGTERNKVVYFLIISKVPGVGLGEELHGTASDYD